jgi:hypothetical protein
VRQLSRHPLGRNFNKSMKLLISIFFAFLFIGCVAQHKDWAFIQDVGGMSIGKPYRTEKGIMLPVYCNVSGLQTITVKPKILNSGMSIKEIKAERIDNVISLSLITSVAGQGRKSTCDDLLLGNIPSGKYSIVYKEPNGLLVQITEIEIAP